MRDANILTLASDRLTPPAPGQAAAHFDIRRLSTPSCGSPQPGGGHRGRRAWRHGCDQLSIGRGFSQLSQSNV